MSAASAIVKKRCEWNRYCGYLAPFYSEHLVEIGTSRPLVAGRCYDCGGFVCNRCAFRRPYESAPDASFLDPWELLCPLDGQPLGRDGYWIVFGGAEESIRRSAGPPGHTLIYEAFSKGIVLTDDSPESVFVRQLLEESFQAYCDNQYEAALDKCANILDQKRDHVNALLLRRSALEKLRRFDEAWETLRIALQAGREGLTRGLAELNSLKWVDEQTRDAFSNEILTQLKQISRGTRAMPALDALYKLVEQFAPDLARAVRGEPARVPEAVTQTEIIPASAAAAAAKRVIAEPQAHEPTLESWRYRVDLDGAPNRGVVTSVPSHLLNQILSGLPRESWTKEDWTQFVNQCANSGAPEFPGGCDAFADRVWDLSHELAGAPLSAQLLVEFPDAALKLADPDLTDLFELYATECFLRASRIRRCFGEAGDPLLVAEQIAGELFQTGAASGIDMLAKKLDELLPAGATLEEWVGALREYVQAFPMLVDALDELGFAHRSFEDFFLARHLYRNLFQNDKAAFKLAGCRCFNLNTAIFLAGMMLRNDPQLLLLEEWLQMKRQRRSLFRGADVPTFVRNLALMRLVLKSDASSLDLTDADFSGLSLPGADFSHSDLTGANFRNAGLRGARFQGCVLTGAVFDDADLSESE